MKSRLGTNNYKDVQSAYDEAYKCNKPFENPTWFIGKIRKIITKEKTNGTLLDIACGDGHFISHFTDNYKCYGVDISKEAIKKARNTVKAKFYVSKAEKLPFSSNMFDFITCLGSLEHFIDVDKALSEMKRTAKKNSTIIIHVPNSNYIVHKILRIDTQHQINERFASEGEWISILKKYFSVEKTIKYNTRTYFKWIPKKYSCHFTFICRNK